MTNDNEIIEHFKELEKVVTNATLKRVDEMLESKKRIVFNDVDLMIISDSQSFARIAKAAQKGWNTALTTAQKELRKLMK